MDNREFTRVHPHIPVEVAGEDQNVRGEIGDIGFEGLWLPTETPLSVRSRCQVVIHLSDTVKIRANGLVVRSEPEGMAIQLLELLDPESFGHLRNLILYNSSDPVTIDQEIDRHFQQRGAGSAPPPPA